MFSASLSERDRSAVYERLVEEDGENLDTNNDKHWNEDEERVSTLYLVILTCGTFGLQNLWSLLLASGTQFLLSIGFSKSTTALTWLVGPLSGTFLQPILGALSDNSRSRWGKRKPFIIVGILGAIISLVGLAFARSTALDVLEDVDSMTVFVKTLSIFWLCMLNLSLQPLQMGLRAFIVDSTPRQQQSEASAWSGRFTALGAIVTYLLDARMIQRYPGRNFETSCLINGLSMTMTMLPCLLMIEECREDPMSDKTKITRTLRSLIQTFRKLPRTIRNICLVQFASWLGWFPFLYYSTTYVLSFDKARHKQVGVEAYLLFALVTLCFAIILPWFHPSGSRHPTTAKPTSFVSAVMLRFQLSLPLFWALSQLIFTACMLATFFVSSTVSAVILVAITGISWSLNLWVPLAMMGLEIANMRGVVVNGDDINSAEHDEQTGTLMSIYNVAISAPQILSACLSGIVFWAVEEAGGQNALGWLLRLGGLTSLGAGALIFLLKLQQN